MAKSPHRQSLLWSWAEMKQTSSAVADNATRPIATQRCPRLVVETTSSLCVRRLIRLDARYTGRPARVSPAGHAKTRDGLSQRARISAVSFAGLWGGARSGHLPVRRQGAKRAGGCCGPCGICLFQSPFLDKGEMRGIRLLNRYAFCGESILVKEPTRIAGLSCGYLFVTVASEKQAALRG